ncbi:MAG: penicillin-binding protein 2 [Armatimonadetes bacterium]|nr:penicillin-binding protein 2 [Armatimonadota bacterium]MDW8153010.1 penicillin-binding protein 2 [Armatimonadota bacterium]
MRLPGEEQLEGSARMAALAAVLTGALGLLGLRLWQLQVLQGAYYDQLAQGNRLRINRLAAPRGLILDRRGTPLVTNRPSFSVALLPMALRDRGGVLEVLSRVLGTPTGELREKLRGAPPFALVRIQRDVGIRILTTLEERRTDLQGVAVIADPLRSYPHGPLAAHVLGYLGEISGSELQHLRWWGYEMGDLIGKAGVERQYDRLLRGEDGEQVVEVDAAGRPLRVLRQREGRPGNTVVLTLDLRLQEAAERALGARPGAVVAMDPRTGEILAMASWPSYDPNLFAVGISPEVWRRIADDPRTPLLNRAIAAAYEPGSVFKVVTGLAALHTSAADARSTFFCSGSFLLGGRVFRDLRAHGRVTFRSGVAQSCNVMFWQLGLRVGATHLARMARSLGFGERTGVDLPGEVEGIVPTLEYKQQVFGEPWYPGDTLNMAIGQGFTLVTPLQVARMMAAVANGGQVLQPRLLRSVLSPEGRVLYTSGPVVRRRLSLSPQAWAAIREGLVAVVEEGTGRAAAVAGLSVAGKTGSAETPRGRPHAWFAGYAPADDPRLVVVVSVEHGARGGIAAAPIARRVIQTWQQLYAPTDRTAGHP